MKLLTDEEIIIGTVPKEQQAFTIKASAKAFKVLSSNLYKNKIRAIVRELACNCADAHVLNGNQQVPFEIKSPTRLDPRFVIRDFGPGLSHDNMVNMYTTFFESTKNGSNDFIGALGLGSKSPLSYTNTFTVVSYFEGRARGYTVLIDQGQPSIRSIFDEPMEETDKTGLEITVPVKTDDIGQWEYEILYVLRPFGEVPPIIKGMTSKPQYFESNNKDWFSIKTGRQYEAYGIYAIYGKIVYPLNEVPNLKYDWLLSRYGTSYVHFELGELDITPSREELSLDPDTIKNIQDRVNSLEDKVIKEDIKKFESIENNRQLLREYNALTSVERRILINRGLVFGGKNISDLNDKYDTSKIKEKFIDNKISVYSVCDEPRRKTVTDNYWGRSTKVKIEDICGISKTTAYVLIDDKPSKRISTIRALNNSLLIPGLREIVVVKDNTEELTAIDWLKDIMSPEEVKVFRISELEDERKKLPEIDTEPKERRPKSSNIQRHFIDKDGCWSAESLCLTSAEIQELSGYFIGRSRDDIKTLPENETWFGVGIGDIRELAEAVGVKEFYVIRPSSVNSALKNAEFESLSQLIIESYIDAIDSVDSVDYVPKSFKSNRLILNIDNNKKLNFMLGKFTQSGKFNDSIGTLIKLSQHLINSSITSNEELALCNTIYNKLSTQAETCFYAKLHEFEKNYPVVNQVLNSWNISDDIASDIAKIMNALEGASTKGEK